jgi:hypothetical protein
METPATRQRTCMCRLVEHLRGPQPEGDGSLVDDGDGGK